MQYLVFDPDGKPVAAYDTAREALDALKTGRGLAGLGAVDPQRVVWFDGFDPRRAGAFGGLRAGSMPAFVRSSVTQMRFDKYASDFKPIRERPKVSLDEAWAKVRGFLPTTKYVKKSDIIVEVGRNSDKDDFIENILNQNYKTSKVAIGDLDGVRAKLKGKGKIIPPDALVQHTYERYIHYQKVTKDRGYADGTTTVHGISLLPYNMGAPNEHSKFVTDLMPKRRSLFGMEDTRPPVESNLCAGSSAMCRQSCLAFSGHNANNDYGVMRKFALTQALVREPEAFVALLSESIRLFKRKTSSCVMPMVRLNVLSDVPWEVIAPWIFEEHSDLQFYDYTKVEGRTPPKNYDLTFSFSGENPQQVDKELARGRRVAVVFGAIVDDPKKKGAKKLIDPRPDQLHGQTTAVYKGGAQYPVIDGDSIDTRPLDPGGVIVGLTWKPPLIKDNKIDPAAFVAQGWYQDGAYMMPHTPRQCASSASAANERSDAAAAED